MPSIQPEDMEDISKMAPQKLMGSFTKSRILFCMIVALTAHVLVIGGTSLQYIYEEWINPEAGEARRETERLKKEAEAKKDRDEQLKAMTNVVAEATNTAAGAASPTGTVAAADGTTNTVPTGIAPKGEQHLLEQRKDTPVVKRITEMPKKGEIPDKPDDIGITIQDTNPM
jgi:hypothetical protein